jgi:hypothetical protein
LEIRVIHSVLRENKCRVSAGEERVGNFQFFLFCFVFLVLVFETGSHYVVKI